MPERRPSSIENLDIYGDAALEWSRARAALTASSAQEHLTWFLGTIRADGRPHAAGVGAVWNEGDCYFTSSPGARKAKNVAADPRCTLSAHLEGIDVVLEGEAARVIDGETLVHLAEIYRAEGWPVEVREDAFTAPFSAPSAGPPPWYLYRITVHTIFGVATVEPHGATRWRFDR